MVIVALDVGDRRIGIAATDPVLHLAHPVETRFRTSQSEDAAYIAALAEERGAERIVCGLPLNGAGEEGEQAAKTREFARQLAQKTDIPIEWEDERFTTLEARHVLLEADMRRDKRKKVIDSIAASYILESYVGKLKKQGVIE